MVACAQAFWTPLPAAPPGNAEAVPILNAIIAAMTRTAINTTIMRLIISHLPSLRYLNHDRELRRAQGSRGGFWRNLV